MDISGIERKLCELPLLHPIDKTLIGLTLLIDSLDCVEAKRVQRNTLSKINVRRIEKNDNEAMLTDNELDQNEIDLFVAVVRGWKWTEDVNGEKGNFKGKQPKYSDQAVREMLRVAPWIKPQIDAVVSDAKNFFTS